MANFLACSVIACFLPTLQFSKDSTAQRDVHRSGGVSAHCRLCFMLKLPVGLLLPVDTTLLQEGLVLHTHMHCAPGERLTLVFVRITSFAQISQSGQSSTSVGWVSRSGSRSVIDRDEPNTSRMFGRLADSSSCRDHLPSAHESTQVHGATMPPISGPCHEFQAPTQQPTALLLMRTLLMLLSHMWGHASFHWRSAQRQACSALRHCREM